MVSKESIQKEIQKHICTSIDRRLWLKVEEPLWISVPGRVRKQVYEPVWDQIREQALEREQQIKNVIRGQIREDLKNGK